MIYSPQDALFISHHLTGFRLGRYVSAFLKGQFKRLPYPDGDFSGKTVIVTGSNCGLGLEAARHFTRLNAKLVILACRNTAKGDIAKAHIEKTTKRSAVVEVWPLNLASFDSVSAFCTRTQSLERIDIVVENAGIATPKFELVEGHEGTITVNVISTFFMALLLLPKLRETAEKYHVSPRLTIVTSDAHQMAHFRERDAENIFTALADSNSKHQDDRYNTSKLLEILVVRELASLLRTNPSTTKSLKSNPSVIINCVNPGYCKSELQRYATPLRYFLVKLGGVFVARSTEVGSRTLFAGAVGSEDTHGKYMSHCVVAEPAAWIGTKEGVKTGQKVWKDLGGVLEGIQKGITDKL